MNQIRRSPQNPYGSYIVTASAGCGKTYQLSRRFIYLVGAGASPSSILTITFTKKAASEMRERILEDAAKLLTDKKFIHEFHEQLTKFYLNAKEEGLPLQTPDYRISTPRTAKQTALAILGSTQTLKITTIDSIFMDWIGKFPLEASEKLANEDEATSKEEVVEIPSRFDILSNMEKSFINNTAWDLTCYSEISEDSKDLLDHLTLPEIKNRIDLLQNNNSYLWLVNELRKSSGVDSSPFNPHTTLSSNKSSNIFNEKDLISSIKDELICIAEKVGPGKRDSIIAAITSQDIPSLINLRFLKKDLSISGTLIRGKNREALADTIRLVDETTRSYLNQKKLEKLNRVGEKMLKLYESYTRNRDRIKYENNQLEFDDTAKGVYRLFSNPIARSARFLIHKNTNHILLDEFQDTSLLQWYIFHSMSDEMLSGIGLESEAGGPPPTVFIVGDEKQSIYGFREADPTILKEAATLLKDKQVIEVPLNDSFRTSQIILDFVNTFFEEKMKPFPLHRTASLNDKDPIIPNHGKIILGERFSEGTQDDPESPSEKEAKFVAKYLRESIYGNSPLLVYDKNIKSFRKMKPSDCAILYRATTHADIFEKALRNEGFEIRREEGNTFFLRPEIRDLIALLNVFAYPTDILSFITVLKSPLVDISDNQVLELLNSTAGLKLPNEVRRLKIIEEMEKLDIKAQGSLKKLISKARKGPILHLLSDSIKELNIFGAYKRRFSKSDGELATANIMQFLELCHDLESRGYRGLSHLLYKLQAMSETEDMGNAMSNQEAITLMTIHKSKGLEFPLIALVETGESWEKSDSYWVKGDHSHHGDGIYYIGTKPDYPDKDIHFDSVCKKRDLESAEENLRLLYVGLTRSRQYLMVTGHKSEKSKKESGYLESLRQAAESLPHKKEKILDHNFLVIEQKHPDINSLKDINEAKESENSSFSLPAFQKEREYKPSQIQTLAPHRLVNIEDHPHLPPKEVQDNKLPQYSREIGIFIHKGLEANLKKIEFQPETVWQTLTNSKVNDQSQLSYNLAVAELEKTLDSKSWLDLISNGEEIETEVEIVHLKDKDLIRGIIDLIIIDKDKKITIVDYKTTFEVDNSMSDKELTIISAQKGYKSQLYAYKDAIASIYPGSEIKTVVYFTRIEKCLTI